MRNPLLRRLILVLPALMALRSQAQSTPADSATMPADPAELMQLASQSNILTGVDARPWHAKVTFKLLDEQGNVTDEGTYEELWAGPQRFKRTYAGEGYTQTDTSAAGGVMRSGQREDVSRLLLDMRRDLVSPMPIGGSLKNVPITEKDIDSGGTKLRCVFLRDPAGVPSYCIATDQPAVRISSWPAEGIQVLHNRILRFQGQYIPGDLTIARAGKIVLSAHLESIEALDPVNDSDFAAAPDAAFLPMRVNISGGVANGMIAHKVAPEYPIGARSQGIQGVVVLDAVIAATGNIRELNVLSGPKALQQAAIDAVRQWRYHPYLLNGVPVEVRTTINVIFSLGG